MKKIIPLLILMAMLVSVFSYAQTGTCSIVEQTLQDFVNDAKTILGEDKMLLPEQADAKIAATPNLVIIDVNEKHEFDQAHLKNAILIPRGLLEIKITKNDIFSDINKGVTPAKETPLLLTCKLGARSLMGAATLKKMGYKEVYCIKGGLDAWKAAKQPLETN
jgi:rhodanese-related sulfurtransferase